MERDLNQLKWMLLEHWSAEATEGEPHTDYDSGYGTAAGVVVSIIEARNADELARLAGEVLSAQTLGDYAVCATERRPATPLPPPPANQLDAMFAEVKRLAVLDALRRAGGDWRGVHTAELAEALLADEAEIKSILIAECHTENCIADGDYTYVDEYAPDPHDIDDPAPV